MKLYGSVWLMKRKMKRDERVKIRGMGASAFGMMRESERERKGGEIKPVVFIRKIGKIGRGEQKQKEVTERAFRYFEFNTRNFAFVLDV